MKPEVPKKRAQKSAADHPILSAGQSLRFHAVNLLFLAAGVGLTLAVVRWVPRLGNAVAGAPAAAATPAVPPPAASAPRPAQPWGTLDITPFAMLEPEEYLPVSADESLAARWFFAGYTPVQLAALFESLTAAPPVKEFLLDRSRWGIQPDGVVLHPTRGVLERLDRATRQRLYPILGESRQNFTHYGSFRFPPAGYRRWFEQSGLHGEVLAQIDELTYTNQAGAICLSDVGLLQGRLTPHEFRQFLRALFSEPAVLVSLRVGPGSDLPGLAAYWGRGGREAQVLALLRAVATAPGGGSISVTHLLPPFARARLYTFRTDTGNPASEQDCFWTTVNFFRRESDPQLPPGVSPHRVFDTRYQPCQEPFQFGDALLFFEENNPSPIHACVYLAADVVFTKNGANFRRPWTLMPLQELLPRYSGQRPIRVVALRPKLPQP